MIKTKLCTKRKIISNLNNIFIYIFKIHKLIIDPNVGLMVQSFSLGQVDKYLGPWTTLIVLILKNLDHGPCIKFQDHPKPGPKPSVRVVHG